MKFLFYNPIEAPLKIHIVPRHGKKRAYSPSEAGEGDPVSLSELFEKLKYGEYLKVEVLLTTQNMAYWKRNRKCFVAHKLTGLVDLTEYRHGGPYLNDTAPTYEWIEEK